MEFEAVIGLETHIQLNTHSKIFCGCKADSWLDPPNTNICPVCCGLPGVLPVLNLMVVEKGVMLAKAMHSDIQPISYFDRKNYFYPDLPKGYQISQFDQSLAKGGFIDLPMPSGEIRHISITKLHIEEDAGKTKKAGNNRQIDFNRCGVPLVEMVTGPDLRSADEAAQYLIRLRQLLRWLDISEADMEKGHLRCDANVSIRPVGADYLNPKTEIKNVNSIDAVRDAINTEIQRQIREVTSGNKIQAWTLEWDEDSRKLKKMRSKETEADYRYFREPDLLPIVMDEEWKTQIIADFPELPLEVRSRFMKDFGLPEYDADILTQERHLADYFDQAVRVLGADAKKVSNWLMNDLLRMMNEKSITANYLKMTPQFLVEMINLIETGTINASIGKVLLEKVDSSGRSPGSIVEAESLGLVSDDSAIRSACQQVVDASPNEVLSYKAGKTTLIGWFVGQVMKQMRGKADPQLSRKVLEELLSR